MLRCWFWTISTLLLLWLSFHQGNFKSGFVRCGVGISVCVTIRKVFTSTTLLKISPQHIYTLYSIYLVCSAGWQSTWIIGCDLAYSRWGPPPTRSLHWFGEIKLLTPCSSITTARHVNNVWRCEMWEYTILPDSEDLCGQMSHFDRFRKCQSTIGHFQLWESAWNDFS